MHGNASGTFLKNFTTSWGLDIDVQQAVVTAGGMRSWVRGFFYLTIMAQLLAPVFDRYHAPDTSATRTRLRWERSVHRAARDALGVYTYTCSLKLVVLLLHASIRYHPIGGSSMPDELESFQQEEDRKSITSNTFYSQESSKPLFSCTKTPCKIIWSHIQLSISYFNLPTYDFKKQ